MDFLYKYYSNGSRYAFDNVENGNICFSTLESLNDPFEGVGAYLYQVTEEEQAYWDSIGSDVPKLLSKRFSDDIRDMVNFKYRIFCVTSECDNPLLWAYYANSHKGFCVGYERGSISKVSDELFKIKYSDGMCPINDFNTDTYKELLSVKSCDWSGEKEWRALYELKPCDVVSAGPEVYFDQQQRSAEKIYMLHGHAQMNNLKTLCAPKFVLKKCVPTAIYLGMRMKWEDKQRLINIAKKLNIKVYQMSQGQNSFGFVPQEIGSC